MQPLWPGSWSVFLLCFVNSFLFNVAELFHLLLCFFSHSCSVVLFLFPSQIVGHLTSPTAQYSVNYCSKGWRVGLERFLPLQFQLVTFLPSAHFLFLVLILRWICPSCPTAPHFLLCGSFLFTAGKSRSFTFFKSSFRVWRSFLACLLMAPVMSTLHCWCLPPSFLSPALTFCLLHSLLCLLFFLSDSLCLYVGVFLQCGCAEGGRVTPSLSVRHFSRSVPWRPLW